jgi:AP-3 complex subunit delta
MFEKNLTELIKGIRAHKGSEAKYIDSSIGECRKEIKSKDLEIKAQAILKLTYVSISLFRSSLILQLQMYGYEFSWASFQVVEVMSSSTFKEKAIGYLAASLSFKPDTDVLMLTTNLIKKVCYPD